MKNKPNVYHSYQTPQILSNLVILLHYANLTLRLQKSSAGGVNNNNNKVENSHGS